MQPDGNPCAGALPAHGMAANFSVQSCPKIPQTARTLERGASYHHPRGAIGSRA